MSETLLKPDVGDAELITAVRGGDVSAYGTLFERHVDAARRLARQLTTPSDADDLVSDAFAKVLRVLQNGGGPDLAFRAYLLTAVRRLHVDKIRAGAKLQTTDDLEKFDPGVPFRDTAVEGFENSAAAAAFASLPERWQLVLWHTEVEGQKPAEVAELLGMSANSVSALAYRAREGLRQAFLNSHIGDLEDAECRWTHDHLGPYIRNGVSKRDGHKVEEHLDGCRKCMAIYLELTEVNSNLSGILAPIILGTAATGYLASGGAAAVKAGFLVAAAGRVRDGVTANVPLSAAIGVAAVSTVVGVTVAVSMNQGDRVNVADDPPAVTSPSTPGATDPTAPEGTDPTRRTRAGDDPSDVPASIPTDAATDPATAAAALPTDTTTDTTTDGGTDPGASDNPGGGSDGPSGGTDGPGTDGPGTDGPGTGGHPPVAQPEFDVDVPRGQQQTTILVSELVQDEDGDELRFVRAALADPHGTLTITSVPVPARGASAAARTEQALVYVPERGWGGRDLVKYRVTDGEHEVDGSFRIQTVNDAPDVHDEDVDTPYGEPATVDLLENDTDPDGDRLTLDITKLPTHGTIERATGLARLFAAAADEGVVTYTPDRGWSGVDTVTYLVDDGHHQEQATLTVTTGDAPPPNRAPRAEDDNAVTGAGQPVIVDVLANDTDPDGDPLTLVSASGAAHGTAVVENGKLTYTPTAGWAGPDTVTYVVTDGTDTATGTLRVTTNAAPPTNRAPEPQDDAATTGAGQPVTVDVLANDTDPDGDPLTLVSTSGAAHGTAEVVAGKVVYTPDAGWAGVDTVTYRVSDGDRTAPATLRVTTTAAPPANRPPVTVNDFADTGAGQPVTVDVLANDTDPDGDDLTLDSADGAAHGSVDVVAGKVVYTPDAGWAGVDTVTYVVSDGTDTATGTLQVTTAAAPPVNQAPVTQPDFADTGAGQAVTVDVLANDTDPDGDDLTLDSADGAAHGSVDVVAGKVVYTPDAGWAGADTVTYVVSDGTDTATGTLTVTTAAGPPVNHAPVTQPDFADTGAGQAVTVDVLANDTDPDGDDLTLDSASGAAHGTVDVVAGKVSYTPDAGWAGVDTVTYVVSDGTDTATGTLQVTTQAAPPANRPPETQPDFADTASGQAVLVDVLANDTDPDSDDVTLVSADGAAHGTTTLVEGKVSYTPDAGWAGADTVTYVVSDGTDTATGTLTVTTATAPPVNRPPVTVDDYADTGAGQAVTVDVLANDTDPDSDDLTLESTRGAAHGTASVENGKVVYTPDAGWAGADTITYVVSDGTDTATGTLTVTTAAAPPVNRAPETQPDFADTGAGQAVTVDVLANDTDPDGDDLTLGDVTDGSHGSVDIVDGKLVYTPDRGWAGADTATYTVTDGDLTATGTLQVTTAAAPPVNRAPKTVEDTALTDFETPVSVDVLANDTDPDGDALSMVSVDGAEHGSATIENGRVLYRPAQDWSGADTMTYVVSDGSDTATGTLHVTTRPRPNRPPTAVNDTADDMPAKVGGSVRYDVLANDTDPDGDALSIARVLGNHPGKVTVDKNEIVFSYPDTFAGPEDISYVVTDGEYESTATLQVTVVNDSPSARDDTYREWVKAGQPVTIDVLANDSDANGDTLTLSSVSKPAKGTAGIKGGAVVYTPDPGSKDGPDSFSYTVRDPRGGEATAKVTVTRPQYDVAVAVIQGQRDDKHALLTARITGYPDQGGVRLVITGQAINAVVGTSLPKECKKSGNSWVCDLTGLTGERRDVPLEVTFKGQERGLRFTVSAIDFEELPGTGANNAADWS